MKGADNATRLRVVKAEKFGTLLEESTRSLINPEVKGGIIRAILNAVSVGASYEDLIKADDKGAKSMNFATGVMSLVGGSFETVGQAIEKMPWAESAISRMMNHIGIQREFNARWLIGTGKWIGVIGGVFAGFMQVWDGWGELTYNLSLGVAMIAIGIAEVGAAFLVLSSSTGVGLVVGLLIMTAIWAVDHFRTDDIQKWLAKSRFGSLKNRRERFQSLIEQQAALSNLAKG